jgi:hypothetical protein
MFGNDWLLVENDGELDVRLLELMGASTKDGEKTIGYFGTGWKYGLALALRKKIQVVLFSGKKKIVFSTRTEEISGNNFDRILFSVGKAKPTRTSLTTRMGEKDWADEWCFFREIVSNAFDEGGFRTEKIIDGNLLVGERGKTRVYLSLTDRLTEVIDNMPMYVRRSGENFSNNLGSVFPTLGEKCRIYKKGIFVRELDAPGLFDYDLKSLTLSESRTADSWNIYWELRKFLSSADINIRRMILSGLSKARVEKKTIAESNMAFSDWEKEDRKFWSEAFNAEFGENAVLCSDSEVIHESVSNLGHAPISMPEKVAEVLRNSGAVKTEKQIIGAGAAEGYVYKEASSYEKGVIDKALSLIELAAGQSVRGFPVKVFKNDGVRASESAKLLPEDGTKFSLLINEKILSCGVRPVIESVYGELISSAGSSSSFGKSLRESFVRSLIEQLLPKAGIVV